HYINYGFYEHRPTTGFDPVQYVAANKDLLLAGYANYPNEALHHYLSTGADEGRPTDFDERAYVLTYSDLGPYHFTDAQLLNHWMNVGAREGRVGDALFGHDQTGHALPGGTVATFDRPNDHDWYELDLTAGSNLAILVTGPNGEAIPATIRLHDRYGTWLRTETLVPGEDVATLDYLPTVTGHYYISVSSPSAGQYKLDASQGWASLSIGGRNYTDADFAGMQRIRFLTIGDNFETQLGPNAQAAGIRFVTATSTGGSVTDASAYTTALTVNVAAGGADVVRTGSGSDHVIAGVGAQTLSLGSGNDLVTGKLSALHSIDGGLGTDTLRLAGYGYYDAITLDLSRITGVERIEQIDSLELIFTGGPSAAGAYDIVGLDARVPGSSDPARLDLTLDAGLLSSAVSFNIFGGAQTWLSLEKNNVGVPNVINYQGNVYFGELAIHASDLGPNVTADGGGADTVNAIAIGNGDTLRLLGGAATDASFTRLSSFEILRGPNLNVQLGAQAAEMGLLQVRLDPYGTNSVAFEPAFNRTIEVLVGSPQDINVFAAHMDRSSHFVDASSAGAAMRFTVYSSYIQTTETLIGSGFATDVMDLKYVIYERANTNGGYTPVDLTNVTGVETINVSFVGPPSSFNPNPTSHGWVYIDTQAGDIQAAQQTINVVGVKGTPEDLLYAPIDASAATANLVINGAIRVKSGSGNDVVTAALDLRSQLETGSGNDTVTGANLSDVIFAGADNDILFGRGGADQLDTGTGNDRVRYTALSDSAGATIDTVYNFVSGSDVVDVLNLQGFAGKTINFAGNAANLAAAQALLTPGDSTLDAVFQQDNHSLWFDNGDGVLNASDLHIVLSGVASLAGADVLHGSLVIG
ncbi:MAG: hypothetical protein QOC65_508, partial [Sphingomonadales bacterium]|nr:hypothetical protein [Sphingomonadales bacterium]